VCFASVVAGLCESFVFCAVLFLARRFCGMFYSTTRGRKKSKKYDKSSFDVYYFIVFFNFSETPSQKSGNFEKLMQLLWLKIEFFHIFFRNLHLRK